MSVGYLRFFEQEDIPFPSYSPKRILDKQDGIRQYISYMFDRTNSMFQWTGLPDTIPAYILELYLQIFGYAAFIKVESLKSLNYPSNLPFKSGVHIFFGGVGGERDIYYRPRLFIAANQRLKESVQATILYKGDDIEAVETPCVLMRNDTNYMGLQPMFGRYAAQMVENDISIRSAQINARAQIGISASTGKDSESARKYLDDLEAGKLACIGEANFLEGISVANIGTQSANVIIQLIELQQYLKASWFNDLGLNANFNMKREYISREEIGSQTDVLLPLVDDMLRCREEAAELLNTIFGLNVSVEKNSAWADKDQTILNSLGAGAVEGDVGLSAPIQKRAKEDGVVQLPGDSEAVPEGNSEGIGGGEGDGQNPVDQNSEEENVQQETPAPVSVEVTVNINEGGEKKDAEDEPSEKSEESDTE